MDLEGVQARPVLCYFLPCIALINPAKYSVHHGKNIKYTIVEDGEDWVGQGACLG